MKVSLQLLLLSLLISFSLLGQEDNSIKIDKKIDLLIQDYSQNKVFKGFRVIIFSGQKKLDATLIRSSFMKMYPNKKSYIVWKAPNFKVKVGNYQTRLEAEKTLATLKEDFPHSFIVEDDIELKVE